MTFATAPEPPAVLDAFYRRVRPGGPGWAQVSRRLGFGREPIPGGALAWTNWIAGIVAVYATLFGIGKLIFAETAMGIGMLAVAAAALLLDLPLLQIRDGRAAARSGAAAGGEADQPEIEASGSVMRSQAELSSASRSRRARRADTLVHSRAGERPPEPDHPWRPHPGRDPRRPDRGEPGAGHHDRREPVALSHAPPSPAVSWRCPSPPWSSPSGRTGARIPSASPRPPRST